MEVVGVEVTAVLVGKVGVEKPVVLVGRGGGKAEATAALVEMVGIEVTAVLVGIVYPPAT